MLHHLAIDDGVDDVAQSSALLEQIFAGLQARPRIERYDSTDEGPAVSGDDPIAKQDIVDIRHAGARRNVDDLVLGERTLRLNDLLAVEKYGANHDH